jgi:integrase
MGLTRRGNVWWIDVKHKNAEGVHVRHQEAAGADEKKARAREAQVKLLLTAGEVIPAKGRGKATNAKPTVATALATCWKVRWGGVPKKRPLSSTKGPRDIPVLDREGLWCRTRRIEELIGDITLEALSHADVADMLSQLKETHTLKDATLRRYLSTLQTALTVAHDDRLTARTFSFKTLRNGLQESKGRSRVMSQEECHLALDYIAHREQHNVKISRTYKTPIIYAFFLTLFTVGSRVGETLKVRVCDVDLKALTLNLRAETTKSRVGRVLPISTLAEFLEPLTVGRGPEERLFDITKQTVARTWKGLRNHLGLAEDVEFVPHGIRHTVGTNLANTQPLPVAQKILGHSKITTTMLYVHPEDLALREAQSAMERHVRPT